MLIHFLHQLRARKRTEDRLIEIAMKGYTPEVVEQDWFYYRQESLLKKCFDKNSIIRKILRRWIHYREISKRQKRVVAIWQAFKDVKLGDGIGIYEADCIDDFLKPDDPIYIKCRTEDEREDWLNVYEVVKDWRGNDCFDFMDLKGKLFHLPVLMLVGFDVLDNILLRMAEFDENKGDCQKIEWRQVVHQEDCELLNLLTPAQKKVLVKYYERFVDNELEFLLNFKGNICHDCGEIHKPKTYTREEAITEIEDKDDFRIWHYLKKKFGV